MTEHLSEPGTPEKLRESRRERDRAVIARFRERRREDIKRARAVLNALMRLRTQSRKESLALTDHQLADVADSLRAALTGEELAHLIELLNRKA
jgi:hypothetical protein